METNKRVVTFTIVGLLALLELAWGSSYLKIPAKPLGPAKAEEGASLGFSPTPRVLKVGEEFEVELILDTKGVGTSGTDVIINYDPALLEVLQVRPGILYQRYPVNEVNVPSGKIGFSAMAVPPKSFAGKGTLAYLKLKALQSGVASLIIEFEKGQTTDSNVVQAQSGGKDILDKVLNAQYSFKGE